MKKLLVVAAIVLAAVIVFFAARHFLEDKEDLSGTWVVVAMEKDGDRLSPKQLAVKGLHFEKDIVVWLILSQGDIREFPGPFQANPAKNPKEIDLADPKTKATTRGIYEIKDGALVLCLGLGKTRPDEFTSERGNVIMVLKRQ